MTPIEMKSKFDLNGYAYLNDFLDLDNCKELTNALIKLVDDNKTSTDTQCPISDSVHGAPVFDKLLEDLLPHFEKVCGKSLYPTYAYARLYRPGEVLKVHTDRPACEISATLTLGFEGNSWPIFIADIDDDGKLLIGENEKQFSVSNVSKFTMNVGDAILYEGTKKAHWREEYKEGRWQAQVFLHYVDANGPHASEKYDGRPHLSHSVDSVYPDQSFWFFSDGIPIDACNKLINACDGLDDEQAEVGVDNFGIVDKSIRDVKRVGLPIYRGIGATLAGMGLHANMRAWKFDISHANQCDYLKYYKGGHYKSHIDTFLAGGLEENRKLTVLAFLNNNFKGGKLFLQIGDEKIYPPQDVGTVLVFPSFVLHGVEPVTEGSRRTIVTWLVGKPFK
jgi:hypothetical protein